MDTVLIVDDSAWSRRQVREVLDGAGLGEVAYREAADGEAALEALAVDPPALVILDLVLPGIPGEEVLAQARRAGFAGPVVALTADVQDATRALLEELGVAAYLNKPIQGATAEQLAAAARAALAGRKGAP